MIEYGALQDKDVACLWFNGWAFQGFDDAKTVLIEAIITELSRQRSSYGKVKDLATSLMKRIDWLKFARRGTGLAVTLAATGISTPRHVRTALARLTALPSTAKSMSADHIETQT